MSEEKNAPQAVIQWYPGHMAKAKRNIAAEVALVDMVIQVVDARAPESSQNRELWRLCGAKPRVLVLNKRDLADKKATRQWLEIYKKRGFSCCAINAARKEGLRELTAAIKGAGEPLMQRLEARGRRRRSLRCMIVGIPNCGKSSVINALTPQAIAKTGNRPGITRGNQWIKTADGFELLDTPGLLWPKFASHQTAFRLAVIGSIEDHVFPVFQVSQELVLWLKEHEPAALKERYALENLGHPQEILEEIGRKRGLLSAGNTVRLEDAAFLLLHEFRTGKLGAFTLDNPWDFSPGEEEAYD